MSAQLKANIYSVGHVDWTVRDFHGYETARGATYNSYLIRDERTALIDTVKAPYVDDLLGQVSALTDLAAIKYVVCNHAETDHSGGFPKVMEALPNAAVVCNKKCEAALALHYDTSKWRFHSIASGETLSLGANTLQFHDTPMLHWPESMFTYAREAKILFSMDAFGQHYATSGRFDDEVSHCALMEEAKTYYANIVMPFGKQVLAALDAASKFEIEMIAPSHGVIWRSCIPEILSAYRDWAVFRPKAKALVIYDTMWDSTAQMAEAIVEGVLSEGVEAELIHIRRSNLTRIATEVLDAAVIAFGTSTLNQGMMPMAGAVLTQIKGLKPQNKAGFAFGSYGWSKGGPEAVDAAQKAMKWEILREPLLAKYRPSEECLAECREAGKMLANKAREMAGAQTP